MEHLERVAKAAFKRAQTRQLDGAVPIFLGVNGLLALIHQKVLEYNTAPSKDILLDIVANGIFALSIVMDEEEFEEIVDEEHPFAGMDHLERDDRTRLIDKEEEDCEHTATVEQNGWVICSDCGMPIHEIRGDSNKQTPPVITVEEIEDGK